MNDPYNVKVTRGHINPARNGGVFYLIFKMSVGYVKSNFELQKLRLWQECGLFIVCEIEVY